METLQLWEQQPHEPARAFNAFTVYRDLGPKRTLREAFRQETRKESAQPNGTWTRWYTDWQWSLRAQAWDRELDALRREVAVAETRHMGERHAELAMAAQSQLVARLEQMDPAELSVRDLPIWLKVAVDVERTARGEAVASYPAPLMSLREAAERIAKLKGGDPDVLERRAREIADECEFKILGDDSED